MEGEIARKCEGELCVWGMQWLPECSSFPNTVASRMLKLRGMKLLATHFPLPQAFCCLENQATVQIQKPLEAWRKYSLE